MVKKLEVFLCKFHLPDDSFIMIEGIALCGHEVRGSSSFVLIHGKFFITITPHLQLGMILFPAVFSLYSGLVQKNHARLIGIVACRWGFMEQCEDMLFLCADHRPRIRSEKPSQDNRELQRYGDGDDFF